MFNVLRISNLLEAKKITKRELSNFINKNENTLQNYLSGKTKIDVETLEKISKVLEVPISYFFDEKENQKMQVNGNVQTVNGNNNNISVKLNEQTNEIEKLKQEISYLKEIIKIKDELINTIKNK